jgi:hypothetical protein
MSIGAQIVPVRDCAAPTAESADLPAQRSADLGVGVTRFLTHGCRSQKGGHVVRPDLAHLAIAFCRCLNIPARYCTTYLGDIGVPPVDAPMDFAGCMEVFLGGAWHVFDPRNNTRRIGRIIIARGRDAGDVAISTAFGAAWLQTFRVWTDEMSDIAAGQQLTSDSHYEPANRAA